MMRKLLIRLLVALPALGSVEETRVTLRQHVLNLINRDRQIYNLPPVQLDEQASAIADAYCREHIRNGTTGHFTLDGLAPYMRYSLAGGNDGVSENAASWSAHYAFGDRALYEMVRRSEDVMMAEAPPHDGHKRTILDPHATHVGIGMAWERGEFRLVHEFIRRYVDFTRPLPRSARVDEPVTVAGRALDGTTIEAITVHHEPMPSMLTAAAANVISNYALPEQRKEYIPRLKTQYTRRDDGTIEVVKQEYSDGRRGDFYAGDDGTFRFTVPFTEGPGMYTVVVWVRRNGFASAVAASNVSIRVTGAAAQSVQGARASR